MALQYAIADILFLSHVAIQTSQDIQQGALSPMPKTETQWNQQEDVSNTLLLYQVVKYQDVCPRLMFAAFKECLLNA